MDNLNGYNSSDEFYLVEKKAAMSLMILWKVICLLIWTKSIETHG